jgi:hypothetical protein
LRRLGFGWSWKPLKGLRGLPRCLTFANLKAREGIPLKLSNKNNLSDSNNEIHPRLVLWVASHWIALSFQGCQQAATTRNSLNAIGQCLWIHSDCKRIAVAIFNGKAWEPAPHLAIQPPVCERLSQTCCFIRIVHFLSGTQVSVKPPARGDAKAAARAGSGAGAGIDADSDNHQVLLSLCCPYQSEVCGSYSLALVLFFCTRSKLLLLMVKVLAWMMIPWRRSILPCGVSAQTA